MTIEYLQELMESDNVAEMLDDKELNDIGLLVKEDFDEDLDTLDDWNDLNSKALKLARQVKEDKTFPWRGASNVIYPLISDAAMNFNARAYPEVVQGQEVVKCVVNYKDDQDYTPLSEEIARHMSYQLLEEIPNWEGDTDQMLMLLPIVGTMFRETTWNEINLRPEINLMLPDELIVNYHAKSLRLEECRRISKVITMFANDIYEREEAGLWLEINYIDDDEDSEKIEASEQEFIQQLRYLDLDDDGYEEPYMVTIHKESSKVVRIVAMFDMDSVSVNDEGTLLKIEPIEIYTDYHFIPSFDGGFYSVGFGSYLYSTNKAIDSLINQQIDAGTLNNTNGGYYSKGIRMRGGRSGFKPGEWKPIETKGGKLADNIMPLPTKDPSTALFSLLEFLVSTGKEMSSVTDVLQGAPQGQNVPVGTTIAAIEQGMKVIDAVYKRIYLGLRREFAKLYRLNKVYLDELGYAEVSPSNPIQQGLYSNDITILPIGDTKLSSQMLKNIEAQAVRDLALSTPGANVMEASRYLADSIGVDDDIIESIFPQGPSIEEVMMQNEQLQMIVGQLQEFIDSGQLEYLQAKAATEAREADNDELKAQGTFAKDMATAAEKMATIDLKKVEAGLKQLTALLQVDDQTFKQQKEVLDLERQREFERVQRLGESSGNGGSSNVPTGASRNLQ